ncbi:hypothetical protein PPERSA_09871 [Pseudocohnilembus persalinus]|uniref:VASt domain-containing protein n=1 Tax=Pseudocohnilembus persalinus TaxID=266149 RepID=A0A0V0QTK8_PSEPJ|nr:hypothetical protein PPERSA_09871 [Pseudocohnilembus persalinus]|eukprot:KRX05731.1 hypothetical protein PPERSA_09871 [Pseudocohnilembus persalinus]
MEKKTSQAIQSIQYYNQIEKQYRNIDQKYISLALTVEGCINYYLQAVSSQNSNNYSLEEINKRYSRAMNFHTQMKEKEQELIYNIELLNGVRKAVKGFKENMQNLGQKVVQKYQDYSKETERHINNFNNNLQQEIKNYNQIFQKNSKFLDKGYANFKRYQKQDQINSIQINQDIMEFINEYESIIADETMIEEKNFQKELENAKLFLDKRITWEEREILKGMFVCSLYNKILLQGRIYITTKRLIFHSYFNPNNFFFKETLLVIPKQHIQNLEKRMDAMKLDNAISIQTVNGNLFFTTFIQRDRAYEMIQQLLIGMRGSKINRDSVNNDNNILNQSVLNEVKKLEQIQGFIINSKQLHLIEERRQSILEKINPKAEEFENKFEEIIKVYFISGRELIIDSIIQPDANLVPYRIVKRKIFQEQNIGEVQLQNQITVQILDSGFQNLEKTKTDVFKQYLSFYEKEMKILNDYFQEQVKEKPFIQQQQMSEISTQINGVKQTINDIQCQQIDFSNRRKQIFEVIEDPNIYKNTMIETVFENISLQHFFMCFLNDDKYNSVDTGKIFQDFWSWNLIENNQDNFDLKSVEKWSPIIPKFYQGIPNYLDEEQKSKLEAEYLQELQNYPFSSKKQFFYKLCLSDLKHIPFAPKSCNLNEKWTVFWVSNKELIFQIDTISSGAPVSEWHLTEEANNVRFKMTYQIIWKQSTIFKSIVENTTKKKMTNNVHNIFVPKLKELLTRQEFINQKLKINNNPQVSFNQNSNLNEEQQLNNQQDNNNINDNNNDPNDSDTSYSVQSQSVIQHFQNHKQKMVDQIYNTYDNDQNYEKDYQNETIFENCTVKQVFQSIFGDYQVKSQKTQKSYNGFLDLVYSENIEGKPYGVSNLKITKWDPEPPKYFKNLKSLKSEFNEFRENSGKQEIKCQKKIDYSINFKDMSIPFNFSSCRGEEKWTVYFISYNYILINIDTQPYGIPKSDSYFTRMKYIIEQQSQNVRLQAQVKNIWVKSSVMKSMVNKVVYGDLKKGQNERIFPMAKIYLQQFLNNQKQLKLEVQRNKKNANGEQFVLNKVDINFDDRVKRVKSQMKDEKLFDTILAEKTFENCNLQNIIFLLFNDKEYISKSNNKKYQNYYHYLIEDEQVNNENFTIEQKLNPEVPKYFAKFQDKLSQQDQEKQTLLQDLYNSHESSSFTYKFTMQLAEFKHIPLAPKECFITEIITIYWVSNNEVIIEKTNTVKGTPGEGSNKIHIRYNYLQQGDNIHLKISYYHEWLKFHFLKGTIKDQSLSGAKKYQTEIYLKKIEQDIQNIQVLAQRMQKNDIKINQIQDGNETNDIIDFKERKQNITSQLLHANDKFKTLLFDEIFEGISFQEMVYLIFSDEKYTNKKTGKSFVNFNHYLIEEYDENIQNFQENVTYQLENCEYFKNNKIKDKNQIKQFYKQLQNYPLCSKRSVEYDLILAEFKNVPFAPKKCRVSEQQNLYLLSDSEVIFDNLCTQKGVPGEGSNEQNIRMEINKMGDQKVQVKMSFYHHWLKSPFIKGMLEKETLKAVQKSANEKILKKIKEGVNNYLEDSQNSQEQNTQNGQYLQQSQQINEIQQKDQQTQKIVQRQKQVEQQIGDMNEYEKSGEFFYPNCNVFDYFQLALYGQEFTDPATNIKYFNFNNFVNETQQQGNFDEKISHPFSPDPPQYFKNMQQPEKVVEGPLLSIYERSFKKKMPYKIPFMSDIQSIVDRSCIYYISKDKIIISARRDIKERDEFYVNVVQYLTNENNGLQHQIYFKINWLKSTMLKSLITTKAREGIQGSFNNVFVPLVKQHLPIYHQKHQKLRQLVQQENQNEIIATNVAFQNEVNSVSKQAPQKQPELQTTYNQGNGQLLEKQQKNYQQQITVQEKKEGPLQKTIKITFITFIIWVILYIILYYVGLYL